jgi:hypothetical protein
MLQRGWKDTDHQARGMAHRGGRMTPLQAIDRCDSLTAIASRFHQSETRMKNPRHMKHNRMKRIRPFAGIHLSGELIVAALALFCLSATGMLWAEEDYAKTAFFAKGDRDVLIVDIGENQTARNSLFMRVDGGSLTKVLDVATAVSEIKDRIVKVDALVVFYHTISYSNMEKDFVERIAEIRKMAKKDKWTYFADPKIMGGKARKMTAICFKDTVGDGVVMNGKTFRKADAVLRILRKEDWRTIVLIKNSTAISEELATLLPAKGFTIIAPELTPEFVPKYDPTSEGFVLPD